MKREIPIIITFVCGLLMVIDYFVPHPPFGELSALFQTWFMIIASFAIFLGILALSKVNFEKIYRKKEGFEMPFAKKCQIDPNVSKDRNFVLYSKTVLEKF